MKRFFKLISLIMFTFIFTRMIGYAESGKNPDPKRAVVRIEVVSQHSSYMDPWKMNTQRGSEGSGCIISGNRILTNAHLVADSMYIQVQKAGDINKYTAEVTFIAHDCDLALLKVKDREFFKGITPVSIGDIPKEGDDVTAYGFPSGGDKISITQGVISRIGIRKYSHSKRSLFSIQIDAALNPGNSGGPVLKNNLLIGVAFQVKKEQENTGYIIPSPVINRFLVDVKDGKYDGYPRFGLRIQRVESEALRSYLKLKDPKLGVYIKAVYYKSSMWGTLKVGDVLLSFDGTPIAKDGTIKFINNDRIKFSYLLSKYQIGDRVKISFVRDGKKYERTVILKMDTPLVPNPEYDLRPGYYIFGGLVFMPETYNYLQTWRDDGAPTKLKFFRLLGMKRSGYSQLVLITKVLAHDINKGYKNIYDVIVTRVNGKEIGSLQDVVDAFREPVSGFHRIRTYTGEIIVLDANKVKKATEEILAKYGIERDRSLDLK